MNPVIGAQRIVLKSGGGLSADGRELTIADGGISSAMLSSGAKQGVLASKLVVYSQLSASQSNPSANNVAVSLGTAPYAAIGGTTQGVLALLQGSDADAEFNSSTGKIGANVTLDPQAYQLPLLKSDKTPLLNADLKPVWAILVVDNRSVAGAGFPKLYFFSGAFSSAAVAETVSEAFFVLYTEQNDLYDMPKAAFRAFPYLAQAGSGAAATATEPAFDRIVGDSGDGSSLALTSPVSSGELAGVMVTADGGPLDYVVYGAGSGAAGAPSADEFTVNPADLDAIVLGETQTTGVIYRVNYRIDVA